MGDSNFNSRVQAAVPTTASLFQGGQDDHRFRPRQCKFLKARLHWTTLDQRWVNSLHLNPSGQRNKLIKVTQQCLLTLKPWRMSSYLTKGVALGRIPSWWEVVQTNFSLTGWEAVWQHRVIRGQWDSRQRGENINTLELQAVLLAPFFFSILSQREFWFLAAVASGLLSWGHLISSDYRKFDFTDTI